MKSIFLKTIFIASFFALVSDGFSQTKPAATSPSVKKDVLLCQEWKLLGIEEFGVLNRPTEKQKGDIATFTADRHATVIHDGVETKGTWSADKGFAYVTITVDGTNAKRMYKILKLSEEGLLMEYQTKDLVRTRYSYKK